MSVSKYLSLQTQSRPNRTRPLRNSQSEVLIQRTTLLSQLTQMSKVLITGGQGYIARNLAPLLEHIGYEVLAPSRTELDILDHKGLHDYCEREHPRVVVHAAAMGGKRLKTDTFEDTYLPNIKMFENISNVQALNCGVPLILIGAGADLTDERKLKRTKKTLSFNDGRLTLMDYPKTSLLGVP